MPSVYRKNRGKRLDFRAGTTRETASELRDQTVVGSPPALSRVSGKALAAGSGTSDDRPSKV
jgi:hypothetical protein